MAINEILKYFPYGSWRKHQREIAESVYSSICSGNVMILEAPTGIGKTAPVLASALAFAEREDYKVLYLVRTKNEAQAPLREIAKLRAKGVVVPYVIMRNKLDMCCLVESRRLPYDEFIDECRYLRSSGRCQYYINAQSVDLNELRKIVEGADVTYASFKRRLCELGCCPYEAARRLFEDARVAVMTYHYVFCPNIKDVLDVDLRRSILIIDEAHNLPYAILDINSFSISEHTVRGAMSDVKRLIEDEGVRQSALREIKNMLSYLKDLKRRVDVERLERGYVEVSLEDVLMLFEEVSSIYDAYSYILNKRRREGTTITYTPLSKIIDFHRKILSSQAGMYAFITCREGILSITCKPLDPMPISSRVFSKVYSAILMSGTMPPKEYVMHVLGINERVREHRVKLADYLSGSNVRVSVLTSITTRYPERTEDLYARIAYLLSTLYKKLNLNKAILAVFPSYAVLKSVRKYLDSDVKYIMELSETDVDQVVRDLYRDSSKLIMAVAGGKLIEGVEFKRGEENLISMVVIVGVPYPEPNDFLDMLVERIGMRIRNRALAWDLIYLWNAIVRVKQSIGRAIRSDKDRAYILLADRRYADPKIKALLAEYFTNVSVFNDVESVVKDVRSFMYG